MKIIIFRHVHMKILIIMLMVFFPYIFPGMMASVVGVNYGQLGDDLIGANDAISLIQKKGFGRFKIFDTNANVLKASISANLGVSIMIPNEVIETIASSQSSADSWVQNNVLSYQHIKFEWLLVGNEVFSDYHIKSTWDKLVPAMNNIQSSLSKYGLDDIKVTTTMASDVLESSYPPSRGTFRSDISSLMGSVLSFLSTTKSSFSANIYPYFPYQSNPTDISADYALFGSDSIVVQDGTYGYTNLFDAMVDAHVAAMERMGYTGISMMISETGWPTKGGYGASISNAQLYNNRVIQRVLTSRGTPRLGQTLIPTFIFALFNENRKPGLDTERNWGVCYPNGSPVYNLETSETVANTRTWCVASPSAGSEALQVALDYACQNGADCFPIQNGQSCYYPNTLVDHASYAFNSYWQRLKGSGGTCYFNKAAIITTSNPSKGTCIYPS